MRFAVLIAAAALSACATATGPDAASRFDAFDGEASIVARYDAVYVAPVTASPEIEKRIGYRPFGATDRTRPLDRKDIDRQTEELRESIAREVGRTAQLRDAPGPGVLTITAELTALEANLPTIAELGAQPSLDSIRSVSVGDAAVRVVLSENGDDIAVIEDRAIRRNLNDPGVGIGMWNTADRFYDRFASKMAALLS